VFTVDIGSTTAEVWYPASDDVASEPTEVMDVMQFVPANVQERLTGLTIDGPDTGAVRDAPVRRPEVPYPAIVFSHGFGGMRLQSIDLTVHLASRGYIVIAPDHPGRSLPDQLPCLFSPALDGCKLGLGGPDPAPPHIEEALAWLDAANAEEGALEGAIDLEHLGMFGHSAGGGTTSRVGDTEERFDALMPMAGAAAVTRDVPVLVQAATCDGIVGYDGLVEAEAGTTDGTLLTISAAGHMAFSDLCELGLDEIANEWLEPREDTNKLILGQLLRLATDGCPGIVPETPPDPACEAGYLEPEAAAPGIRHYTTVFFDAHLRALGDGVQGDIYDGFVVE
jgi:dienelactone hydrolase